MAIYANRSFIFNSQHTWSYEEYFFRVQETTQILIEMSFYEDIMGVIGTKEQPVFTPSHLECPTFGTQDRNYFPQYFMVLHVELFIKSVSHEQFYSYLLSNSIIKIIQLYVYGQLSEKYRIESGQIYGVDFMLYEKNDLDHKHSLFLLHLQRGDCKWVDLYRLMRLANAVKKELMVVLYTDEDRAIDKVELEHSIATKNIDILLYGIKVMKEFKLSFIK